MGAAAVGEIALNLAINSKEFKNKLNGIKNTAKKAGAALVAAFSVKKLVDFGKQCIELGSDLAEVQNVVDVTFTHMSGKVNEFAQNAATSYGLSETMAKKFVGTFGAMAKSFGFSEDKAYEMSTALTGLAGDVASFYNISQNEAYTKLKSVFTGETETLKDLGVVMTQSALDAYALANGYGKTTQKMSELEKVSLRYAFVQDQLAAASGDFERTSDSWANQTRILTLQFESLKATIGQGLINLFNPVIKVINTVVGKLVVLANAFKAFTELINGGKAASGMSDMASAAQQGLDNAAGAADNLASGAAGAGKAAKKAAKEMQALMGFDEVQKLDKPSSDSSGNSGSSGAGSVDFGGLAEGETVIDKTDKALSKLIERAKELAGLFTKGFQIGFGDSGKNIAKIKQSLESIGSSLKDIFTSKEVTQAAGKWADSVALNLGKITGSVAGVGIAVATNLTSGVAKSLEEKKPYIKEKLASLFTISAETWNVTGDFASALGEVISKALTSDAAIDISADVCSMLTTGVLGGAELFGKLNLDLSRLICQPFIDNKDKISEAVENTLKPVADTINTLKTAVEDAFSIIGKVYDEHIAPMFRDLTKGCSDTFGKLLDTYNTYVAPVLKNLSTKFREVYDQHLKPCMENIGGLIGTVIDAVKSLFETWIKPYIDWLIETIVPFVMPVIELLGKTILTVFGVAADALGSVIKILDGVITFLTGVFTGDWDKAWDGIKKIFQGLVDWVEGIINGVKDYFGNVKDTIIGAFNSLPDEAKEKFKKAWDKIKEVFADLKSWFNKKKNEVITAFNNIPRDLRKKFSDAWKKAKGVFNGLKGWFEKKKNEAITAFNNLPRDLGKQFSDAWKKVKEVFSGVGDFFGGLWDDIKKSFSGIGDDIGNAVGDTFKSVMNSVFETIEKNINRGIGFINSAIGLINKIPGVNVNTIGNVALPRLAQGGYVKKNTPQLAMIGDNRHQGEIVAPENKLNEMAEKAARAAGSGGNAEVVDLLRILISLVEDGGDIVFRIDSQDLARANQRGSMKLKRKYITTKTVCE